MELRAIVCKGQILLPASVHVPDGTEVRVVVDDALVAKSATERQPIEPEPLDEADVMADLRWATGRRFC
jgi:hypothetical protein